MAVHVIYDASMNYYLTLLSLMTRSNFKLQSLKAFYIKLSWKFKRFLWLEQVIDSYRSQILTCSTHSFPTITLWTQQLTLVHVYVSPCLQNKHSSSFKSAAKLIYSCFYSNSFIHFGYCKMSFFECELLVHIIMGLMLYSTKSSSLLTIFFFSFSYFLKCYFDIEKHLLTFCLQTGACTHKQYMLFFNVCQNTLGQHRLK